MVTIVCGLRLVTIVNGCGEIPVNKTIKLNDSLIGGYTEVKEVT
jgi:hypothetical protein